jgi:hypothetical protein
MAIALLASAPPPGDANAAQVIVSARVLPYVSTQLLAVPPAVQVTRSDVARGFVDGSAPARLRVKDNMGGFVLSFDTTQPLARRIHVRGLGQDVEIGPGGGTITYRTNASGAAVTSLGLSFRFDLDATAAPGLYAFPVRISVMPL